MSVFIKEFFKKHYPFICLLIVLANFIMAYSCWKSVTPRHFYHVFEVTNSIYYYTCVTQFINRAAVDSLSQVSQASEFPCLDYRYYLVNGIPRVKLWGRQYFIGSQTSRGRITGIFPDRCILDNGCSIVNSESVNGISTVKPASSISE